MTRHEVTFPPHPHDRRNVVHTFKALADETRIELILILSNGEQSVSQLVAALEAPQSTVSRHLGILRAADLVATRRHGTSVYYRLASAHIGGLVKEAFSHAEHERLGLADHASEPDPSLRTATPGSGDPT